MACFHPVPSTQNPKPNGNGKRAVAFGKYVPGWDPVHMPCGQCVGCRLERSRQWAIRCVHESQLHEENSFITLTYNDENLPEGGTLCKRDMQLFWKRLREKIGELRYYYCGEYGEITRRPHYHAIVFGKDFEDKKYWKTRKGIDLYTSQLLEDTWQKGYCSVGSVTFESAAYVARYVMKKITGDKKEEKNEIGLKAYEKVDMQTGEIYTIAEEYTDMSRRPGIAREWFMRYAGDCYPKDSIFIRGKHLKPPKYYDAIYDVVDKKEMDAIKKERRNKIDDDNYRKGRLKQKEIVKKRQVGMLKRSLNEAENV